MRFLKIYHNELDMKLSPNALLVYSAILAKRRKDEYAVISTAALARCCSIHRNSVLTAVKELCAVNAIVKLNRHDRANGYRLANCYVINQTQRSGKFIKVPYDIFYKGLSATEFTTYLHMKKYANSSNYAFPSLSTLSRNAGICLNTVIKAIRALAALRLIIKKTYIRVCGCFGNNNYILKQDGSLQKTDFKGRTSITARYNHRIHGFFIKCQEKCHLGFKESFFAAFRVLQILCNYLRTT